MIVNGVNVKACNSKTILHTAIENKIPLLYQCNDGYCGCCRAKITKGEVSYKIEPIASCKSNEIFMCLAYATNDEVEISQY